MTTTLLRGGLVVDGTGSPARPADVLIRDDTIEAVLDPGGVMPTADTVIDVDGLHVAPGFIDTHSHLDLALLSDSDAALPLLRQGCTTVILGQDGTSYAPVTDETMAFFADYWSGICGPMPDVRPWRSVAEYLAAHDKQVALNVGFLVPHGNVRALVMGIEARPATAAELARMADVVAQALAEGALGISTGLHYLPCAHADTDELVALATAAAGSVFVTHMRDYEHHISDAIRESVEVGRRAGTRVHLSHLNGRAPDVLPLVDEANSSGVSVTYDTYPYLAGSTTLTRSLPGWAIEGSVDEIVERLQRSDVRQRLQPWLDHSDRRWEAKVISSIGRGSMRTFEGARISGAAGAHGSTVTDLVCDLLVDARLDVGVLGFRYHRQDESDVRALLRHPAHTAGSDGIYVGKNPHPRGWGTFAEFICLVRDEGLLSIEELVRHLTSSAARIHGLSDRGTLAAGYRADVVAFRLADVRATATYENGRSLAEGVEHVLVNGTTVLTYGRPTSARPGRALRRGTATQ